MRVNFSEIFKMILETLGMTFISCARAYLLGLPMGILLNVTSKKGIMPCTVLVLSGVTKREDIDKFPYRPKYVLNGVGDIINSK